MFNKNFIFFITIFEIFSSCKNVENCPRAKILNIPPGPLQCPSAAAVDHRIEFDKVHKLRSTCKGSYVFECSGITETGQAVKFKCDQDGCEWIANWLW